MGKPDESLMSQVGRFIRDVGFPAAMAIILLYALLAQLPPVTQALVNLTRTLDQVGTTMGRLNQELSDHRRYTEHLPTGT